MLTSDYIVLTLKASILKPNSDVELSCSLNCNEKQKTYMIQAEGQNSWKLPRWDTPTSLTTYGPSGNITTTITLHQFRS